MDRNLFEVKARAQMVDDLEAMQLAYEHINGDMPWCYRSGHCAVCQLGCAQWETIQLLRMGILFTWELLNS